jgi:hypothetical protein
MDGQRLAKKDRTRNRSVRQSQPPLARGLERKANALRDLFQLYLRKAVDDAVERGEEFFGVSGLRDPQDRHSLRSRLPRIVISTSVLQDLDKCFRELVKLGGAEQAASLLHSWTDEVFKSRSSKKARSTYGNYRAELVRRLVDSQAVAPGNIWLHRWQELYLSDVPQAARQFVGMLLNIFKAKLRDRLVELVATETVTDPELEPADESGKAAGLITKRARLDTFIEPEPLIFTHSDDYLNITFHGQSYTLTENQAIIIKFLHEAYKQGSLVVHKDRLLTVVNSRTSEVRGFFRNSPLWNHLIIQGERRSTYRLNLPPFKHAPS